MLKPSLYILIIVVVAVTAVGYRTRIQGLFSCSASGYAEGYYLAYCHGETFGDYDHGAFWFGLEPDAVQSAAEAEVLFLGSSRMQFALSTAATSAWFSSRSIRHYLLGFAYTENVTFVAPLLAKLSPRARAYVINVDRFFLSLETPPGAEILQGGNGVRRKYQDKRRLQYAHRQLCTALPTLCGAGVGFFRRPQDGHWRLGGHVQDGPVVAADVVGGPEGNRSRWASFSDRAKRFVEDLPVDRRCVFLTLVPANDTSHPQAVAIAQALETDLLAPEVPGLRMFDGSHLDELSAARWSAAFFEAAGARLQECAAARTAEARTRDAR